MNIAKETGDKKNNAYSKALISSFLGQQL